MDQAPQTWIRVTLRAPQEGVHQLLSYGHGPVGLLQLHELAVQPGKHKTSISGQSSG